MKEQTYKKLKNFQRVKTTKEIFRSESKFPLFEDSTIRKIQENIFNYKKKEQERQRKIEALTQLLKKIEEKSLHTKYTFK